MEYENSPNRLHSKYKLVLGKRLTNGEEVYTILTIRLTSKSPSATTILNPGCDMEHSCYLMPAKQRVSELPAGFLQTTVLLNQVNLHWTYPTYARFGRAYFEEWDGEDLEERRQSGGLIWKGVMRDDWFRALIECALSSDDVAEVIKRYLRATLEAL